MRLFAGIAVPHEVGSQLDEHARRAAIEGLRYTTVENMHLTVYFLGQVQDASLPDLCAAMDRIPVTPLLVTTRRLGTFPRAGVLFAEVDLTEELRMLQASVATVLPPFAARPDPNSPPLGEYHPHITLARTRELLRLRAGELETFRDPIVFQAGAVNLYQSRPTPSGSRYEVLHTVSGNAHPTGNAA